MYPLQTYMELPMTGRMPTPWADTFRFDFRSTGDGYGYPSSVLAFAPLAIERPSRVLPS
jgi:hypothetical protein